MTEVSLPPDPWRPSPEDVRVTVDRLMEYSRGIAALRRRGISPRVIRHLIDEGEVALPKVRVLMEASDTPPARKGLSRACWRVLTAFGFTDPHDTRRVEVADWLARFNAEVAS